MLALYNSLECPHLVHNEQFWSLCYKKYIEQLEKIQGRITRMIPRRLLNKPSEKSLKKKLNLFSLFTLRLRGNFIRLSQI